MYNLPFIKVQPIRWTPKFYKMEPNLVNLILPQPITVGRKRTFFTGGKEDLG